MVFVSFPMKSCFISTKEKLIFLKSRLHLTVMEDVTRRCCFLKHNAVYRFYNSKISVFKHNKGLKIKS